MVYRTVPGHRLLLSRSEKTFLFERLKIQTIGLDINRGMQIVEQEKIISSKFAMHIYCYARFVKALE